MLKGYAVNQRLLKIENQLASQQKQLADQQEKIDFFVRTSLPPVEQIFFEGEFFVASTERFGNTNFVQKTTNLVDLLARLVLFL